MEDLEANKTQPPAATLGLWLGYGALCVGMFMAILDIQVVVTSLAVIEDALENRGGPHELGADHLPHRRNHFHSAHRAAHPHLHNPLALRRRHFDLHSRLHRLRLQFRLHLAHRVPRPARLCRRGAHPLGVCRHLPAFRKGPEANYCHYHGGLLAVLAPTLGPLTGGWITDTYTWHWLFLINVVPGIATLVVGLVCLPQNALACDLFKTLDWIGLVCGRGLAALQIGLKDAPEQGWTCTAGFQYFTIFAICLCLALRRPTPAISGSLLRGRFLTGCILSFILGIGLFVSVYLIRCFSPLCVAWDLWRSALSFW